MKIIFKSGDHAVVECEGKNKQELLKDLAEAQKFVTDYMAGNLCIGVSSAPKKRAARKKKESTSLLSTAPHSNVGAQPAKPIY